MSYVAMSQVLHACIPDDDDDDDDDDDGRPGPRLSIPSSPLKVLQKFTDFQLIILKKEVHFTGQFVTVSGLSLHKVESFSRSYQSLSWPEKFRAFHEIRIFLVCSLSLPNEWCLRHILFPCDADNTASVTGSL